MKIILFVENIQHGGLDTFCSTLLNAWPDSEDVFVVVCNSSHPGKVVLQKAVMRECEFIFHNIPLSWSISRRFLWWLPFAARRSVQPFLRIIFYPLQLLALRSLLRSLKGDALLVVNGGFPGGESCRIANIAWADLDKVGHVRPSVHNFHNFAVKPRFGLGWFENRLDRLLVRSTNHLISVSRSCANSLRFRCSFREAETIGYIYNGINSKASHDLNNEFDLRKKLKIGNAPLCLLLANYEPRKGHRFLFEVFSLVAEAIPSAHLVACGGGGVEERAVVEAARRELAPKANIHLLSFVPDGPKLIDQADVVAISSQSFESFGLTAVEAMARGVPVVATRVGGLPEVVGDNGEGGYVVEADDVKGFAAHLIRLLREPQLRKELGILGRQRAETLFAAQRMAEEYRKLLIIEK
ncbi:glycosyltransferase family 4 protein [Chromobacterium haemolyticum]|uniref:Glycosyltransferase family 4 protein n=1 Tax=Chromobacterium fluminis TaxID=3044269 RepID=A0ABX0L7Z9_9NEIS|nr:glycosyltransferase family 4 protein [Chromobacterium haemolyticum]NHR06920.1 glycosyltransferase family 4 protein [Chromobacterium haemolyticum]